MQNEHRPTKGWVAYDGECGVCLGLAARWRARLERRGFALIPLQEPWVMSLLGPQIVELCLIRADSSVARGADALIEIARNFWWLRPGTWLARIPIIHLLLVKGYKSFARRRHCLDGICRINQKAGMLTPLRKSKDQI